MNIKGFSLVDKSVIEVLNYKKDQQGIIKRYLNEKDYWDAHLEKTRNFIVKCFADKKKVKVAVLGSGWLLDIPIIGLSNIFEEVYLFDIIHPEKIKRKLKSYTNIFFKQYDLTDGMAEEIYKIVKSKNKKSPENLSFSNTINFNTFDLVISANLLNQLDIHLKESLKKLNIYSNGELTQLSVKIQNHHINSLPKDKTCLITDYKEMLYDKNDAYKGSNRLVYINLPEAKQEEEWDWFFDTKMTYNVNYKTIFKVKALEF